jgi:hypothetical protein
MSVIKLIGDAPNQVSRNRDLGDLAYQSSENVVVENLTASGNVGIGNTAPTAKLDVTSGAAYTDIAYKATGGFAVRGDGRVDIGGVTGQNAYLGIYKSDASAITNYIHVLRQTGVGFSIGGTSTTTQFSAIGTSGIIQFGNTGVLGEQLVLNTATGNVGINTTPNASAILDVQSTTKGVRMPNMTTTQKNAIVSPVAGLVVFDTTLSKLSVYTGAAWETITSA